MVAVSARRRFARRTVALIGDSTLHQDGFGRARVLAKLAALGWAEADVFFYAASGKGLEQPDSNGFSVGDNIAQARAYFGRDPDIWMINLGGNLSGSSNSTITLQVNSTLANLAQGAGRISWIGLSQAVGASAESQRLNFNSVAQPLVTAKPTGVWHDWNGYLRALPDDATFWGSDGIHMTTKGYDAKNVYYASVVGQAA